jgi:hypothetical protein
MSYDPQTGYGDWDLRDAPEPDELITVHLRQWVCTNGKPVFTTVKCSPIEATAIAQSIFGIDVSVEDEGIFEARIAA